MVMCVGSGCRVLFHALAHMQMYYGSRLVHADYMFNGYGTTRGDFLKQVGGAIYGGDPLKTNKHGNGIQF